ncbi:MAG: cysteine synthase A [Bacteroidales bacterium]
MKYDNILQSVGNTPHIRLSKLFPRHEVWIKDERRNPGGSIKDRIAVAMIEDAENTGKLKKGGIIVEPTSGNTGIGLAMAGTVKNYRVILVMPDTMSEERRRLLIAYGAELVLTPGSSGMKGAIERAMQILEENQGSWMPMQFENPANPAIHSLTTAAEILDDFPEGFDFMVAGVGTGGHIAGAGRILKENFPGIKIIAVEPYESPVISGGKPAPHKIQGIGAGFIPGNFDPAIVSEVITVKGEDAYEMTRLLASSEGLMAGISTGAVCYAVNQICKYLHSGTKILTFAYDTGERYLSMPGLWHAD